MKYVDKDKTYKDDDVYVYIIYTYICCMYVGMKMNTYMTMNIQEKYKYVLGGNANEYDAYVLGNLFFLHEFTRLLKFIRYENFILLTDPKIVKFLKVYNPKRFINVGHPLLALVLAYL